MKRKLWMLVVAVLLCGNVFAQQDSLSVGRKKVGVVLSGGGAKEWRILAC